MRKKLITISMVIVMMLGCTQMAGATSLPTAKSKKSEAQNNLSAVQSEISSIESKQAELQEQIDELDAELVQVIIDINTTQADIEAKKVELAQAEADFEAAKETEAEQYESMKERIVYMYENGDSSFLTALMGADSFADVLNKIESYSTVYDYDRALLIEYQNTKLEVEDLVAQVENEKAELEEIEATYEEQQVELETVKAQKSSELSDYESKLAAAESLAAQYQETIDEQNAIIAAAQAAVTSTTVGSVTSGSSSVSSGTTSSDSSSSTTSSYSGSGSGSAVVSYACQFLGNPYVYGGTSLTNGCDCSGFVMSVYAHFGVSLPHSSSALRSVGTGVSVSDMQPGDIVCYSGHVGIYVGNNTIINASSPSTGIKYSTATYKTILAVRRIF
ncbi:MAG: NlpC/P60 family protein [Clostridiales bacterium]|nr:NlpC/P60 family protein [Clostridiales bacterium]